jgi:hypothetical protein
MILRHTGVLSTCFTLPDPRISLDIIISREAIQLN